jgi:nucleotide-binding universal stress UspA family protein
MPDLTPRVPFRKAVLALNGGPTDELVIHLGCQLAKASGGELIAIHVIEVDWRHELSEEMTFENEAASALLDMAEGIAEQYKVKIEGDLLQAREVAAALVDEAIEVGADAIIVGLPYRQRFGGDFQIGDAIPYIFKNAPCQVIVVREPVASSTERQTAERAAGDGERDRIATERHRADRDQTGGAMDRDDKRGRGDRGDGTGSDGDGASGQNDGKGAAKMSRRERIAAAAAGLGRR